jgi:hypothetical protein
VGSALGLGDEGGGTEIAAIARSIPRMFETPSAADLDALIDRNRVLYATATSPQRVKGAVTATLDAACSANDADLTKRFDGAVETVCLARSAPYGVSGPSSFRCWASH